MMNPLRLLLGIFICTILIFSRDLFVLECKIKYFIFQTNSFGMLCSHYAFDIFTLNIIKIKKRGGRMDKKNTVVLFHNYQSAILMKVLALKERKFEDALRCFEILRQYNAETEQTELASVICLLELKRMEEAKDKCEQLLKTGVVLFGDILETYVTILVQTNDYEGVIETVEKVLQTKDIMPDQKEKLAQLALFAEGMLNEGDASLVDSNFELDEFTNEIFGENFGQKLRAIQRLSLKDLDLALPVLKKF